jgi:hypothetical protein
VVTAGTGLTRPSGTRLGPYEILLAVMGVSLSLCCTDKSPTRPDRNAPSSAAHEESTLAARLSRPAPHSVAPRTPMGPPIQLLRIGGWGSPQSSGLDNRLLTITGTGATLRSECSKGVIEEAIVLDAAGHFDVLGTYQFQAGPAGPTRPARFVGFAIGETLTLTVILAEDNQTFGPFALTFGQVPKIGSCPIV